MNLLTGKYQVFVEQVCDRFKLDPKCREELVAGLDKYDRAMCEAEGRLLPREWLIRNIRNGEHLTENGNWGVNVPAKRFPSHDSAYGAYRELFGEGGEGWDKGYRIEEAPEYRYESDSHIGELVKKAKELGGRMDEGNWAEIDRDDAEWISHDLAENCMYNLNENYFDDYFHGHNDLFNGLRLRLANTKVMHGKWPILWEEAFAQEVRLTEYHTIPEETMIDTFLSAHPEIKKALTTTQSVL